MRVLFFNEDPVAACNGRAVLPTGGRSIRSVPQRELPHTDGP